MTMVGAGKFGANLPPPAPTALCLDPNAYLSFTSGEVPIQFTFSAISPLAAHEGGHHERYSSHI
jgi:hypothetical protein